MKSTEQTLIDFFLNPRSYPERPRAVSHVETHISHVFIGDRFVYKIKKPVDFGFLDFSTLKKRHFFCEQEVMLNSRLAKGRKVIVDATYLKADQRKDFHETCIAKGLNPFFIHCFAREAVLKDRIRKRMEAGTDVSDADIAVLEHQLKHLEEPEELPRFRTLRINTEEAIRNIVYALREFL